MRELEVIILAGGFGKRLRGTIGDLPKPMAPVNGEPFLSYLFRWLEGYGVKRVVLSTGYRADVISGHYGSSFNTIDLLYAREDKPLGTGGAIVNAMKMTKGDPVLVINGDTWFPVDLDFILEQHFVTSSLFTMVLKRMVDFSRYGTVGLHEGIVTEFNEKKKCDEGLINGGIYLMNREIIGSLPDLVSFSLENDFLGKEAVRGTVRGIVSDAPFIDIGVPDDYLTAGKML